MRRLVAVVTALALVSCGTSFVPVSEISAFRALAVRAEPPDLHPGDTTTLSSLVVDPSNPTAPISVIYIACDPDPSGFGNNPCSSYQNIADASALIGADGNLPSYAHFVGINTGTYTPPANLFDGQPADATVRQAGALAVVLAIAVETDVTALPTGTQAQGFFAQVLGKAIPSAIIIKRIRVSEDPNLAQNPQLGLVATRDDVIRTDHPLLLEPGDTTTLFARGSEHADESYVVIGPDGTQDDRTEASVVSWFTSAGSFAHDRTLQSDTDQTFTAPDGSGSDVASAIPGDRRFNLWVVLRDGRGGVDWQSLSGLICDDSTPASAPSAAAVSQGAISITGANLDQLVDVTLDGVPLDGLFQPAQNAWVAKAPAGLAAGAHALSARDHGCRKSSLGLTAP